MLKEKYFQLMERADECNSIGVVRMIGSFENEETLNNIKKAIEAHFDSEVENIKISNADAYGNYAIYFDFTDEDRETEIIDAVETWLYF